MIRLTTQVHRQVVADLQRPHAFAEERVGFLFSGLGTGEDGRNLVLIKRYQPVADEHYIDHPKVGAAISAEALRRARQESLTTGDGIFHVHMHGWPGVPAFSRVDLKGYQAMVPSFLPMAPTTAHGALLLSPDNAASLIWYPGRADPVQAAVRLIGFPMAFWGDV